MNQPVLVSPDASEMVGPVHNLGHTHYESFIGFETGKIYDTAMIRIDSTMKVIEKRLDASTDLPDVLRLFCADDSAHMELFNYIVKGMLCAADVAVGSGLKDGNYITPADITEMIET